MIVRDRAQVEPVDWGNGLSHRLLTNADGMGFTIAHTIVRAGTRSALAYSRHLEACYCISGSGQIVNAESGDVHDLGPGVLYALNEHDQHYLIASDVGDMQLVSVFNPPLTGEEHHDLTGVGFSRY
ncbi:MAG: ectoine synthase [Actinomycetota bacterium]|nr:ectoine synthase [Actinomycetota bacterium]MDQ2958002.1 ectoine synthase [Actinomycetota bacterium]